MMFQLQLFASSWSSLTRTNAQQWKLSTVTEVHMKHVVHKVHVWHIHGRHVAHKEHAYITHMAHMVRMWYTSELWHIHGTHVAHIWHVYDIHMTHMVHMWDTNDMWHIQGKYTWHICGICRTNIWRTWVMCQAHITHVTHIRFTFDTGMYTDLCVTDVVHMWYRHVAYAWKEKALCRWMLGTRSEGSRLVVHIDSLQAIKVSRKAGRTPPENQPNNDPALLSQE